MIVKFTTSITLLARLQHDFNGDPQLLEEWTFEEGEELEVSSIEWGPDMKYKRGSKAATSMRFAKLNIEEQKGYVWMAPEDAFDIL